MIPLPPPSLSLLHRNSDLWYRLHACLIVRAETQEFLDVLTPEALAEWKSFINKLNVKGLLTPSSARPVDGVERFVSDEELPQK